MPGRVFFAFVACISVLSLTGCLASTGKPIVEVREIKCPSVAPPDFGARPALPDTNDIRDFEPYAYRADGWGESVEIKQSAYRESWEACP